MLGVVSLLGDFVYEGGRSVLPDYMRQLGMSALLVGSVLGFAELAGWLARPLGGLVADRTGRFSAIVRVGYAGVIVVPLMAFARDWLVLALLVFAERMLRGLRVPARDAMLARMRGSVGLGTAFGLHELLDQFGATAGPLLAALVLVLYRDTGLALLSLLIPYLFLLIALLRVPEYSEPPQKLSHAKPTRQVYLFSLVVGLNAAGLLPLPIILYLVSLSVDQGSWLVPLTYTLAMIVDAVAAMVLGRIFDRAGPRVLASILVLAVTPCLFVGGRIDLLLLAAGLVGVVVGAQESVFRAMVARLAVAGGIGGSYAVYGLAIGAGSAAAGFTYGLMVDLGLGLPYLLAYSIAAEALALIIFAKAISS
jgi:MFS family permease